MNNMDESQKNTEIGIIEMKNVLLVMGIIVLGSAIIFNNNKIKKILKNNPFLDEKTARNLDVGINLTALIIVVASLCVAYREFAFNQEKGEPLMDSKLRIIAWTISIIPAATFLYLVIIGSNDNDETGTEPLV